MPLALLGASVAGVGSAPAPNLALLGVTRVVAGGCFAALIPSTLVYVGDMWPAAERQRPLSDVLAASSLGIATATAGAGLLADLIGWRAVPALTGVAGAALWFAPAVQALGSSTAVAGWRRRRSASAHWAGHGWCGRWWDASDRPGWPRSGAASRWWRGPYRPSP